MLGVQSSWQGVFRHQCGPLFQFGWALGSILKTGFFGALVEISRVLPEILSGARWQGNMHPTNAPNQRLLKSKITQAKACIYEQTEIPRAVNLTQSRREKSHRIKNCWFKDGLKWDRHLQKKATFSTQIDMRLDTHVILFPPINRLVSFMNDSEMKGPSSWPVSKCHRTTRTAEERKCWATIKE